MTIKKLHSELSTIVEGMTICDADGKQVGTVDTFYLGEDILGTKTYFTSYCLNNIKNRII